MPKAIFNWSGGKDSSLTLHYIRQQKEYDVQYLLTSINKKYQRISMHGVRKELLDQQADSLGIALHHLMVPEMPSMEDYERLMKETLEKLSKEGIEHSIYGDIFLEDLKKYREDQLAKINMKGVFPIWKIPTDQLVEEFINLGFKAIVVCINEKNLDKSFVGREIDAEFVKDLPKEVDPCGENGEFHSFVYDGPIFEEPISIKRGDIVYKKYEPPPKDDKYDNAQCPMGDPFNTGFWYCDLLPKGKK